MKSLTDSNYTYLYDFEIKIIQIKVIVDNF